MKKCKISYIVVLLVYGSLIIKASEAISLWAFPNASIVSGTANIGVVAYHSTGINNVEFFINGESSSIITQETINPETSEYEFVFPLNTLDLIDNEWYTIGAVSYPNDGEEQVLPDIQIIVENTVQHISWHVSNAGNDDTGDGSENLPFQTIQKALNSATGGDLILLSSETYSLPGSWTNEFDRFVTIKPEEGASPIINSVGYLRDDMLKLENISFDFSEANLNATFFQSDISQNIWITGCTFIGVGPENFNNAQTLVRFNGSSGNLTFEKNIVDGVETAFVFGSKQGKNIIRNNMAKNLGSDFINPNDGTLITGNEIFNTKAANLFLESINPAPFNLSVNNSFSIHHCENFNECDSADYDVYTFDNISSQASNTSSVSLQEVIDALNANFDFFDKCWAEERDGHLRIYSRRTNIRQQMWVSGTAADVLGYNEISYSNQAEGSGAHSDMLQYWGIVGVYDTVQNIIFRNNNCYNNSSQGLLPVQRVHSKNMAFVNNVLDAVGKLGFNVSFESSPDEGEKFDNILFEHNTIWDSGNGLIIEDTTSLNMTFRNNIFGRRYAGFGDGMNNEDWDMNFNCYYWFHWKAPPAASHSIVIETTVDDPIDLFRNVVYDQLTDDDYGNFNLSENSVCRDAGTDASGIFYDINWKTRDAIPDIGAFEYSTETSVNYTNEEIQLQRIYPNPFNTITTIEYTLPEDSDVEIVLYDLTGRKIENLYSGYQNSGIHTLSINVNDLNPGIYFYKMKTEKYEVIRKCIKMK